MMREQKKIERTMELKGRKLTPARNQDFPEVSQIQSGGVEMRKSKANFDCLYLGGMVRLIPDANNNRISGFGEPYCILMNCLPCPENCPDKKVKG